MSSKSILLGVNIDHVATVRQARYKDSPRGCGQFVEPDPVTMALLCEKAGAQGITVHPREDARHIQQADVRRLRECIATRLNMEMAATDEMLAFALEVKPETICVVPESREEVTTEGGLEVAGQFERIEKIVKSAADAGIESSLFIDPVKEQIEASAKSGASGKKAALMPDAFQLALNALLKMLSGVLITRCAWSLPNTAEILSVASLALT